MKLLKSFKVLLVASFVIGVVKSNAQTAAQKNSNQPPVAAKNNQPRKSMGKVSPGGATAALDENDPYMGRTQEFLERLTVNELPADFPKYQKNYGVSGYNDVVDNYYRTHGSIVKEWVKRKLNIQ